MGLRTLLRRLATLVLGLVDTYWAMREPGQYGDRPPQCEVHCEGQACVRDDRTL
ncbi:MAG: hypothetical protein VKK03_02085 [Synechococcus sp.]|nr:hypothetical protein [Synechococcus sp.]